LLLLLVLGGCGPSHEDAYRALGVIDGGPAALVQAQAESEPPEGLEMGARLHPRGTLARLRYEQVGTDGTVVASYEARALVPPLPYFGKEAPGSDLGSIECPEACREHLQRSGSALIARSGRAGLAHEWVMRMRVGKTYSLGRASVEVQDIGQEKPRSIPYSMLRVTLLETCAARPRIGASRSLDYAPYAIVPIPTGWRHSRWVEVGGCKAMMDAAPTVASLGPPIEEPKPAPRLRPAWPDPAPDWQAVRPRRSGGLNRLTLEVDEPWLARYGKPLAFRLLRACRYDATKRLWIGLELPAGDGDIALREKPIAATRVAFWFPEDTALYFAEWMEIERDGSGAARTHSAMVPAGSVTCRESELPATREPDEIVACVPSGMVTDTRLVPDPTLHCAAPAAIAVPRPR
jgi:hypothetical protein